jgi:hypothetical protein
MNTLRDLQVLYHSDPRSYRHYLYQWADAKGIKLTADNISDSMEQMFQEAGRFDAMNTYPRKRRVTEKDVLVMSAFLVIGMCVLAIGLAIALEN